MRCSKIAELSQKDLLRHGWRRHQRRSVACKGSRRNFNGTNRQQRCHRCLRRCFAQRRPPLAFVALCQGKENSQHRPTKLKHCTRSNLSGNLARPLGNRSSLAGCDPSRRRNLIQSSSNGSNLPGGCRLGSVTFLQRFGKALNPHFHFHCCIIDGVFDKQGNFYPANFLSPDDIQSVQEQVRKRVVRLFQRRGPLDFLSLAGRNYILVLALFFLIVDLFTFISPRFTVLDTRCCGDTRISTLHPSKVR